MEGTLKAHGDLAIRHIRPGKMPLGWCLLQFWRNLPGLLLRILALVFSRLTGVVVLLGELRGKLIQADGTVVDLGVLGYKMVTTAWCTDLCSALFANDTTFCNYDYHDAGTGVGAESAGNTALGTPWGGARATGTPTNPTGVQYQSVGTISFNNTFAITEHGLFGAATTDVLFDRTVFTAVNVVNGDSIQFTYLFTATAGG